MPQKSIFGHNLQAFIHALQWVVFALASIIIIPVVVGISLGLDTGETASFIQRTLFFVGIFSFVQLKWGHRCIILEGPGGMWYSLFIIVSLFYPQMGMPLEMLRSNLVAGLLLAGLFYIILAYTGLYDKIRPLFSPLVNGTFLILMPLSLSATVISGIIGEAVHDFKGLIAALGAIVIVILVSLKARGFLQSISILCGIAVGWVAALLLGVESQIIYDQRLFSWPELFPWGRPTIDYGVLLSCFVTSFLILSNHVASIHNMHKLVGSEADRKVFNRGLLVTGLANLSAAFYGLIGFIPYASAIGFVKLTGMSSHLPFMLFSLFFVIISLFPQVSNFFASMPEQIGYAVLLVVLCQVMGMGLREYARLSLDSREVFICGLSLLIGVGIMFLPFETFHFLSPTLRIILGNGLIMGLVVCIFLEKVIR